MSKQLSSNSESSRKLSPPKSFVLLLTFVWTAGRVNKKNLSFASLAFYGLELENISPCFSTDRVLKPKGTCGLSVYFLLLSTLSLSPNVYKTAKTSPFDLEVSLPLPQGLFLVNPAIEFFKFRVYVSVRIAD